MDVYILARIFKIRAENRTENKIIIHAGDTHIENLNDLCQGLLTPYSIISSKFNFIS